jgi:hypothetical protein
MLPRKAETFQPVTLGHIRSHGCRDVLICCCSINCSHSTNMNDADHLPDDTAIRALAENGMHETRTRRRRRTTGLVTARQQAVQWVDGTTL